MASAPNGDPRQNQWPSITNSPQLEAADRLAIRELFDAYAHCADRRDADGQKALFTAEAASSSTWTARAASRHTCSKEEMRSRRCSPICIATT